MFQIVNHDKIKTRTSLLSKTISLIQECYNLNNFFSVFALSSALQNDQIYRLRQTWEGLTISERRKCNKLFHFVSSANNYRKYRLRIKECALPSIPFLDLSLYDISLLYMKYPTLIDRKSIVDFAKLHQINQIMIFLRSFNKQYSSPKNENIQNQLKNIPLIPFETISQISQSMEPRSTETKDRFLTDQCWTNLLRKSVSSTHFMMEDETNYGQDFLDKEDSEEDIIIIFDPEKNKWHVRAGTVQMLVKLLTKESATDPAYLKQFLLTYRSFSTPTEFLNLLIQRFYEQPSRYLDNHEQENFHKKQNITRLKIISIINQWIKSHFYDFTNDPSLQKEISNFLDEAIELEIFKKPAQHVKSMIAKQFESREKKVIISVSKEIPKPILPKSLTSFKTLDIHHEELARQLTLIEFDLFCAIEPKECLSEGWLKKDKEIRSPNIVKFTKFFNQVGLWAATEILKCEKLRDRVQTITYFIKVEKKCREFHNFNTVQEIIAGLEVSPIYRLKKTWESVPEKIFRIHEQLISLMSLEDNYKGFRDAIQNENPPCIPYLGVYFTDLVFLGSGNKDTLPSKNGTKELVNFEKCRKISKVIETIQQYQQFPYFFQPVKEIRQFIESSVSNVFDETEMFERSFQFEAKKN
ncbi:guanine nucleotide exchange factor [Anaeramoeba ignava]|uniref:Guanine nucleotide exchange factor n=1 Tax=Anaeramoeba ignava TaxID=1746090 RepID=A0A9Q0L8U0_ANAIG|nr:guanine nucleotide exchange factor [Anaeramoeba ignava]